MQQVDSGFHNFQVRLGAPGVCRCENLDDVYLVVSECGSLDNLVDCVGDIYSESVMWCQMHTLQ